VNELIVFGGNANLKAQTATTWTVGADWHSEDEGSLRVHVNYYNIRFSDRINDLQSAGYNVFDALPAAGVLGPQIVQLNPSAALVQQFVSSPNFVNFGADVGDIGAVVDSRSLNLSRVKSDGVDLRVEDRVELKDVALEPGIDVSNAFHLETRFTSSSPEAEMLNTIYNPTRTKIRGHLLVARREISVTAFVNYVNSYTNNLAIPPGKVASWTTFDLSATYDCDTCRALFSGFSATLGILNVLNKAPPFALNANGFAVNYDGANANPLGRFISLDATIRW
jgi:outer membrane receptor protein involved in Fe transport